MKPAPLTITDGETCAEGHEEWQKNLCYVNCPAHYTDNGLSCFKDTITRDSSPSYQETNCGVFQILSKDNTCKLSSIGISILIVCVLGITYLAFIVYQHLHALAKEAHLSVEDSVVKKINSYFLSSSHTQHNLLSN